MMNRDKSNLFPVYFAENQEAQMRARGVVFRSASVKDNEPICVECEAKGIASFICSICGERRSSKEIQESFGDPAEHLCKVCYSSVSAEVWEKKVKELWEAHRWENE
jgi:hypothetical protein